jgi:hypothetical protein
MNDAVRDALAATAKALANAELARQKAADGGGEASSFQPPTADTLDIGAAPAPPIVPPVDPPVATPPVPPVASVPLPDGVGLTEDDRVIGRVFADGRPEGDDSLMPPDPDNVPLADASSTTGPDGTVREAADEDEAAKAKADRDGAEALYAPDQERDEGGRWTAGGTAAGRHAERTASPSGHATAANYHKAAAAFHLGEAGKPGNTPERTIEHTEAANSHAWAAHWHNEAKTNPDNWTNQKIAEGASRGAHSTSREANAGNTPWAKWRTDHAETHPSQTPHRGWPTGWPGAKAAASPEEADRQALIARAEAELALDQQKLWPDSTGYDDHGRGGDGGGASGKAPTVGSVDVHVGKPFIGTAKDIYYARPHDAAIAEKAKLAVEHNHAMQYHDTAARELDKLGYKNAATAHAVAAGEHDLAARAKAEGKDMFGKKSDDARKASRLAHRATNDELAGRKTKLPAHYFLAAGRDGAEALYSEDQERDEHGRWAAGGGSEGKAAEKASSSGEHAAAAEYHRAAMKKLDEIGVQDAKWRGRPGGASNSQPLTEAINAHATALNTHLIAAGKFPGNQPVARPGAAATKYAQESSQRAHLLTGQVLAHWPPKSLKAAARSGLVGQSMAAAVLTDLKIVGPATDAELPPALRGKGLIRGSPVKLWPIGTSEARDGRVFVVNRQAVASLLADGNEGIAPVPFTYVHEDPEVDPMLASKNAGYMTHFSADAKFIYADGIYWTKAAAADLQTGERGFVSPDAYCQPLDSDTLKPLPAGAKTTHYMPLYWRAASLVPVPALSNLPPASLSAQAAAARPTSRKESNMDRETLAALGLDESATPDQVRAAVQALKTQKLDAIPPQFLKKAHDAGEHDGKSNSDCPDCSQKAAADAGKADDAEDAKDGGADEATEKAAAKATAKAIKGAIPSIAAEAAKSAMTLVRADLKAQDAAAKIDAELETFEKAGKLVAADREFFRTMYGTNADKAREILSSRRAGAIVPDGRIESAGIDPSLSVDALPLPEAGAILSRAAGWHLHTGKPFELALVDVRSDARDEGAFHRMVLKCNPDWGKEKKTGERGIKWPTGLRKGYLTSQELDADMLKKIGQQLNAGRIPTSVIPAELQRAALERMSLAGEASNFQPPTKFQVAGFGFGYFQGEFGGSEIAVEVTGGANEEASYPVYGTEKLQVSVNASGLPEPVGRNAQDIDESVWGADFKKVTLHGYGNRVWADRRDQSAGDAVLPMGVMATVTEQALTIEKNKKELVQAATLRNAANYNTGFVKSLTTTRQWHLPTGTPIQDWQGARVTIWRAVGAFPDLSLMPPDVVESLRFHPDFLKAAQAAGMSHIDQPEAMVPIEMLVAILGPLIVPTCRISTKPGGLTPDTPWAQDVILAVTSRGKVVAPRAFATVVSAGYPMVRGLDDDKRGLNGSDGIAVSDMYTVEVVGAATPSKTSAAFLFQTATIPLTVL